MTSPSGSVPEPRSRKGVLFGMVSVAPQGLAFTVGAELPVAVAVWQVCPAM